MAMLCVPMRYLATMSDRDVERTFVLGIVEGVCGDSWETRVQAAAAVRGFVAKVSHSGSGVKVQDGGT